MAVRASSRRPRSLSWTERVLSERARLGRKALGARLGKRATDGDGFFDRGQGVLAALDVAEPDGEVVERAGEVGEEGVGARLGALAVVVDGFFGGGQGGL